MTRLLLSIAFAGAALAAAGVNFSGKWALQSTGGRGGPTVIQLNQVGDEVTGSISVRIDAGTSSPVNTEILGGKVDGSTLTFYVWTGTDSPQKAFYKGTLTGEEIVFTITGGVIVPVGLNGPQPGTAGSRQITAKRAK